ncbi:MAG TPA: site-specific DNA-methyltransferase [Phycisphaerae bacterium]|nr:site-specific DNA-methyltransferase [Phycisphaerae bacterium]
MPFDRISIGDVQLIRGDWLPLMAAMPAASVDLVFGSPPYEDARTYDMDFKLKGQDWVDWMVEVVRASLRVSKGLVGFVVEGRTRKFRWSATPALLMADLHRAGVHLRKPPVYRRVGIPGSGGPDWWRNDYEFIICCTNGGELPWSENTATGHPPKYKPGGRPSHRQADGQRVHGHYKPPELANPGNIIDCGAAGGGNIGDEIAHEGEAPFPEALVEPFVRCFCPPGGTVLDPFLGSGTTVAVALRWGRKAIGVDVRESQIELTKRRIEAAQ